MLNMETMFGRRSGHFSMMPRRVSALFHSAALLSWALHLLTACGSTLSPPAPAQVQRTLEPPATPAPAPRVEVWSARGGVAPVRGGGIGEHTVHVLVHRPLEGHRWGEDRLHAIDRASRRAISRVVGYTTEIIRVDPLIVDTWDGERARWLGTRVMHLSDALEPEWRSDPMNFMTPDYATGPLVLIAQEQAGEYVGLHPEDGTVVFRLRSDPDDAESYTVEAGSFIAIPLSERTILVDRQTGEISGVVDSGLGEWEIVGDRLIVALPDRLTAYDGHGREVWSREGVFPHAPARTILSWSPADPPARSDVLLIWQRGRGLVAIDETGTERWVHPLTDEEAWTEAAQHGDRVFLGEGKTMLDVRSGEVLFECTSDDCVIVEHDEQGVLVRESGAGGVAAIALYGSDGQRRWRYALTSVDEGRTAALLSDVVAICQLGSRPVIFLDRSDGSVLSTHPMPGDSEARSEGRPVCWFHSRDDLVLAVANQGAALFGPSRGDEATPEPFELEPLGPAPDDPPPASRPLYRLAVLVPPAEGDPPAYVQGRAAAARARDAFHAGRFQEAASGFIEAYRAFIAADPEHYDVLRLGLECCYNARLSVDHGGGGPLYDALLASLDEEDARCRNIVIQAPPPSRPF